MAIHRLLDQGAELHPHRTAILSREGTATYGELRILSRKYAAYFKKRGVRPGERIVALLPNGIPAAAVILASSVLGAPVAVLHEDSRAPLIEHVLRDAEPRLFVTEKNRLAGELPEEIELAWIEDIGEEAIAPADMDALEGTGSDSDPACLIYTSGSTGMPKAVVPTRGGMMFAAASIQEVLRYREDDVIGLFLPLSFDYGLYQLILSLQAGATLAIGSPSDVGPALLNRLIEWKVTGLPAMPAVFFALNQLARRHPAALPPLRFATNTGAKLPDAYLDEFRMHYPECGVYLMYGLTECKRVSILKPSELPLKPGSVGRPLPGTECFVVDGEGRELPPGEIGEFVIRGPHLASGYWRDEELTGKAFRPWRFGPEKVLFTGDYGSVDEEGFLYVHGRRDDVFKLRGHRVSRAEIEEAVLRIPGVGQAVVLVPVGEEGAALLVTTERPLGEVRAELRRTFEPHKIPERIERISSVPLNGNGKYDLAKLRRLLEEGGTA